MESTGKFETLKKKKTDLDDDDSENEEKLQNHHHHKRDDEIFHLHPHDPLKCAVCTKP